MTSRYRRDIDGLRAIAVSSVVLFHAHRDLVPGGYVGVDVFFVISGYLICSRILSELGTGRFSLADFYERRARRILPALLVMLVVSTLAAVLVCLPNELAAYGKSLAAAALSGSNILFWSEAGYFDGPSEAKPLLHTWSLGVEEQFYLLVPLLLMAAARRRAAWTTAAMIACSALSLGWCVWTTARAQSAAFYLLPSRAWELLAGALIVLIERRPFDRRVREAGAWVGAAAIGYAVLRFDENTLFPGLSAALPVVGSMLIMLAGSQGQTVLGEILSLRAVVAVGLVSYSFYLWHWPALVLGRLCANRKLAAWEASLAILIALALAIVSWRFVERPFRDLRFLRQREVLAFGGAGLIALAGIGAGLRLSHGMPHRLPPAANRILDTVANERPLCHEITGERQPLACAVVAARGPGHAILWGDSHAMALAPGVAAAAERLGMRMELAWSSSCPPLLGVERTDLPAVRCAAKSARFFEHVARSEARIVLLAARWALLANGTRYRDEGGRPASLIDIAGAAPHAIGARAVEAGLVRTLAGLERAGKRVILIGAVPEVGVQVPETLARARWHGRAPDVRPTRADYEARQARVLPLLRAVGASHGSAVVWPHEVLCANGHCDVTRRGLALYSDDDHLSHAGALLLSDLFARALATPGGG